MAAQSSGITGQRFVAFMVTVLALNATLALATYLGASIDLAKHVIEFTAITGMILVLGRTGVHIAESWANRGKPQSEKTQ